MNRLRVMSYVCFAIIIIMLMALTFNPSVRSNGLQIMGVVIVLGAAGFYFFNGSLDKNKPTPGAAEPPEAPTPDRPTT